MIRSKRIVGGKETGKNEYPFHVSLWYVGDNRETKSTFPNMAHVCGGTLIANQWVLTAAHCFDNDRLKGTGEPIYWRAYVGIHEQLIITSLQFETVKKIVRHVNYNLETKYSDIALIKLGKAVDIKDPKISVATLNSGKDCPKKGDEVQAIGWGQTKSVVVSQVPNKITLDVKDSSTCGNIYNNYLTLCDKIPNLTFDNTVLCAGTGVTDVIKTAPGDSGSPLLATCGGKKNVVVGVVSYGHPACNQPGFPSIFTNVSPFYPWIQTTIRS